jgi:hypothetical protein
MKRKFKIIAAILMIAFGALSIYLVVYKNMTYAAYIYLGGLLVYFFVTQQLEKSNKE